MTEEHTPLPEAEDHERPLESGARLGRYRVLRTLGSGAMGVVYAAEDEFKQPVALKVVSRVRTASAEAVSRFRTEAVAASKIGHRNIAEVFEFGTADDGSVFIAMELLEGEDLRSRLKRLERLPLAQVAQIAEGVAAGLAVAREQGIVHRDLKPENIFLARGGTMPGVETVKVLDFGVAKALGPTGPGHRKTGKSGILGTPEYMAPEQAAEGEVDPRSDIYALGCVLYECATGRPPFRGKNFVEVLAKHLRETPVPPAQLDPPVELPPLLEAAILRALAKDPTQRQQRIEELAASVRAAVPRTTPAPPVARRSSIPPNTSRPNLEDPTSRIVERITREFEVDGFPHLAEEAAAAPAHAPPAPPPAPLTAPPPAPRSSALPVALAVGAALLALLAYLVLR